MRTAGTFGTFVSGAPFLAPVTTVVFIRIQGAIGIKTFNIREIKKPFIIGLAVGPDLVIPGIKVAIDTGTIEVPRHVNKDHTRISLFQFIVLVQIGVDPGFRVIGTSAAPGPDNDVDLGMSVKMRSC